MEEMEVPASVPQLVDDFLLYVGKIEGHESLEDIHADEIHEEQKELTVAEKIAVINEQASADVCDFFVENRIMDSNIADMLDKQFTDRDNFKLLCEVAKWMDQHPVEPSQAATLPISADTLIMIRNALRPDGNHNGGTAEASGS